MENARNCPQCRQRLAIDSFEVRGNTGFRFKKCIGCRKENCKFVCDCGCGLATNNIEVANGHITNLMVMENIMAGRPGMYGVYPEKF